MSIEDDMKVIDTDSNYIKLHGLKRTGTNYAEFLVRENFDCEVLRHATNWKHTSPYNDLCKDEKMSGFDKELVQEQTDRFKEIQPDNYTIYYLILAKNPYSWYYSMSQYNNFDPKEYSAIKIDRWNVINRKYMDWKKDNPDTTQFIPYELLLNSTEDIMRYIGSFFGINVRDNFIDTDEKLDTMAQPRDEAFDKRFYFEEQYIDKLGSSMIEQISWDVDEDVMDFLGYEIR